MYSVGILRLARVLSASLKIQDLSLIKVQAITSQLFGSGGKGGVHKNTVSSYMKGTTQNPQEWALRKLAPLIFQVEGFTEDDEIGYPIFKHFGVIPFKRSSRNPLVGNPVIKSSQILDDSDLIAIENAIKPEELPLFDIRYKDQRAILDEILGESQDETDYETAPEHDPVKRLFQLYPIE